jgi:hypothetical protein
LALVAFAFVAVLATEHPLFRSLHSALPVEARGPRCNWACHNHGCPHHPVLPAFFTEDSGIFGWTVRGLYLMGALFSDDKFVGYGISNLLVFCVLWPGLMYGLCVRAIYQWLALRELRRS